MSTTVSKFDDVIDSRDIIARVEELECEVDEAHSDDQQNEVLDMRAELSDLSAFLQELKGNGGDEQWRGDWYPVTLVRDSYFKDYAQELADELAPRPEGLSWPYTCIDWDQAARELQMDYSSVEFDGVTYWYR